MAKKITPTPVLRGATAEAFLKKLDAPVADRGDRVKYADTPNIESARNTIIEHASRQHKK